MGSNLGLTRRQFLQLCVAGPLMMAAATACDQTRPFNLGVYQHPGHEAFYISEHSGLLPSNVMLRKSQSSDLVLNAMLAGELDAATLALDEVLVCLTAGVPLQVILVLAESCGANVLLARPEFSHAIELKGKIIAMESRASTELLLDHYLNTSRLQRKDIEIAYLPQLKQLMAWENGQIDAAINSPPVSHYFERSGAKPLFDTRACPSLMYQVLAVRTDRVGLLSDISARLLNSFYLGMHELRLFEGDSIRRTAQWRNLSLKETQRYFASVKFPTPAQNLRLLANSPTMQNVIKQLMTFMPDSGLKLPDAAELFNTSALRQLVFS